MSDPKVTAHQGDMDKVKFLYEFPGQHVYEGMPFPAFGFPKKFLDKAREFEFREGDIVISSYPKSGTSWMQELAWLINNNADTEAAGEVLSGNRAPSLEYQFKVHMPPVSESLKDVPGPRIIKTHLPYRHYEREINKGNVKVIYLVRNPKDVLVSLYYFYRMVVAFGPYPGTWNDFFELFKARQLFYGDWFEHFLPFWEQRSKPNILFVQYEELHRDLLAGIRQLVKFCEKSLTDEQVAKIAEHCTFENMKKNPMTNRSHLGQDRYDTTKSTFLRKGQVGDWKNYFTVAQSEYFDELYKEKLKDCDLDIKFEM